MIQKFLGRLRYFTKGEKLLWCSSVAVILVSFFLFRQDGYLSLAASLIGVTALLFNAKGHPFGQVLMIIFALVYGYISWTFSYYGEMITYLGMSAPMAAFALVSWLRHPFQGKRSEVQVNCMQKREVGFMLVLTVAVTIAFYFLLQFLNTANLIPSTISVTTSFLAVYLTFRRSPYFAFAYAANDLVLIVLWSMAARTNVSYVSVIICFVAFLANDIYGFVNWLGMRKRQQLMLHIATESTGE